MNLQNRVGKLEQQSGINPAGGFNLRRLTDDELTGIEAALSRTVSGDRTASAISPELEAALERVRVTMPS